MQSKSYSQVRAELKLLLFHFAKECEQPGFELQGLLREVIHELHDEVKAVTRASNELRLVACDGTLQ